MFPSSGSEGESTRCFRCSLTIHRCGCWRSASGSPIAVIRPGASALASAGLRRNGGNYRFTNDAIAGPPKHRRAEDSASPDKPIPSPGRSLNSSPPGRKKCTTTSNKKTPSIPKGNPRWQAATGGIEGRRPIGNKVVHRPDGGLVPQPNLQKTCITTEIRDSSSM